MELPVEAPVVDCVPANPQNGLAPLDNDSVSDVTEVSPEGSEQPDLAVKADAKSNLSTVKKRVCPEKAFIIKHLRSETKSARRSTARR